MIITMKNLSLHAGCNLCTKSQSKEWNTNDVSIDFSIIFNVKFFLEYTYFNV